MFKSKDNQTIFRPLKGRDAKTQSAIKPSHRYSASLNCKVRYYVLKY